MSNFKERMKAKSKSIETKKPIQEKPKLVVQPTPELKKVIKDSPKKPESQTQTQTDSLDQIDFQIMSLLSKKYKEKGINIVRHNQRNPFLEDFSRLAYLIQSKRTFEELFERGLLEKTKHSGQWQIK